jgi:glyoxylase-like metal-dependent hydrolase (beta-lactamase superfamily II)
MPSLSRHAFLEQSSSCAAHLALAASALPVAVRNLWARQPGGAVVARETFGTLEQVAEGVWALISTPLNGDRTTLANGGLIAGREGVLAVEGFFQPAGATWLAGKARELTGRWPTHVVVTHYHGDHANGVAGYGEGGTMPAVRATGRTRDDVVARNRPPDDARAAALAAAELLSDHVPATLDLGRRRVRIVPREGHTASDVSVELDEPSVVFCGDLVWNAMVPNYVDAVPSKLAAAVRALASGRHGHVPGQEPSREPEFDRYVAMIDAIEEGARPTRAGSRPRMRAAFALPASLGSGRCSAPPSSSGLFGLVS